MMRLTFVLMFLASTVALCCGPGCSGHPSGPAQPKIDPDGSGAQAIAEYDKNGDGKLDAKEIESCPALQHALQRVDANHDGQVTADEIANRIRYWMNSGTTIMDGSCEIKLDGEPLGGATVTFEPEKFLGPAFTPCTGETDAQGQVSLKGPDPEFPGVYLGFYRVRVSKLVNGKESLPARFNTDSQLGYEVSDDLPDVQNVMQFELTSK